MSGWRALFVRSYSATREIFQLALRAGYSTYKQPIFSFYLTPSITTTIMAGVHWITGILLALSLKGCLASVTTVTVSATAAQAIPTTLWGLFCNKPTNSVKQGGDGGIYGELLQNRAFQKVTPNTPEALTGWRAIGGAGIAVVADPLPVSAALPNALQVTFPTGKIVPVGFGNTGYFGINVIKATAYKASFYYRFPTASTFKGTAVVGLQTAAGLSLGSVSVAISGTQTTWLQVSTTFTPSQSSTNTNNLFFITLDGTAAAGQTINFAMLSLFPPTYLSVVNGMRVDLGTAVAELTPGFLRFPGGRNLGNTIATRWQWNATVGKLVDRPGRIGTSGYVNTDGLGLYEFLTFCERISAKPIMGVYSGLSLDGSSVQESDILPYIQQAVDQVFILHRIFVGALRSSLGHAAAFPLTWVEIGNEVLQIYTVPLRSAVDYAYSSAKVQLFVKLTRSLGFIASSNVNSPILSPDPTHWDVHMFQTPAWFAQNSRYYDGFQRNGTLYLEGEYAARTSNDGGSGPMPLAFPTLESALGEAAFMTGIERNSDIVFGAAYSPLLNNVAGTAQQSPSLISFDLFSVYRSISFYSQKLFATNRPVAYLPSTLPDPNGSVFWSIGTTTGTQHIFKVVNIGGSPENITFVVPFNIASGTITVLKAADPTVSNSPTSPSAVVPVATTSTIPVTKSWTYVAPPFSLSIMRV
ncbi:glycoside hydrolase superfamily [Crucibulum laeve]|uniref:non-reducing end alpha-L-arabinofuranosidase n=1 Tax=Crucibulum laeve TaxID=68775 RepID=A0A5C3LYD7_9AGAR|nr:glycoside hydrolase superfamily [Crucibulum laeve]